MSKKNKKNKKIKSDVCVWVFIVIENKGNNKNI